MDISAMSNLSMLSACNAAENWKMIKVKPIAEGLYVRANIKEELEAFDF